MSDQSSSDLPSVAEIAALTTRLRALSNAGAAADPTERARFLADKDALLDRISAASSRDAHLADEHGLTGAEGPPLDAGPALTAEDAAHELAADGRSLDEARVLVSAYLDDVSAQIGASAHQWGLDAADLAAIRADQRDRTVAPAHAAPQLHEHSAILNRHVGEDALGHPNSADGADPWDGYRTYTPAEATAELVVRGVPPDVAPGVVDRYLDGLTGDRGWSPQDQWEIDDDDLAEMAVALESPTELPADTGGRTPVGDTEPEWRAQLAAWHDATDPADDGADDLNRSTP